MSDDESARRASTTNPSPEPTTPGSTATTTATADAPAEVAASGDAAFETASPGASASENAAFGAPVPEAAASGADVPETAAAGADASRAATPQAAGPASGDTAPEAAMPGNGAVEAGVPATAAGPGVAPPGTPRTPGRVVALLKEHAVTIVLAVLLVGAIVWGALGMVSTNTWESRASSLATDLAGAEDAIAEAEATIDELETAKDRAETTATACVGAIDDVDAMLEVAAEVDEKTEVYVDGLSDFMAALNSGDLAGAETIGAEVDKLSGQIDDLNEQIEEHIEDYGDSAEGCHVDDPQDV